MDNKNEFSYWKKAWHKWIVFAAGIIQIPLLLRNIANYNIVIEADIFTPEKLSEYILNQRFNCLTNILCAVVFIGLFIVGCLARDKKSARLGEGILALAVAAALTVGIILSWNVIHGIWGWVTLLTVIWFSVVYSFVQFFRERARQQACV